MSWNSYSVFLGARRAVTNPRMPKGFARLTAAVLDNPVAMIAFVAADSRAAAPISEIMANARLLEIDEPIPGPPGRDSPGTSITPPEDRPTSAIGNAVST